MIDLSAIQSAFAGVVRSNLGLSQAAVRIANQNAPEPPASVRAWVSVNLGDILPRSEVDAVVQFSTAGSPDLGEEITLQAQGLRALRVSVQAFTRDVAIGNASATALLAGLASALYLPSNVALLRAAGLALQSVSGVRDLSAVVNEETQGRALLELGFELVATAEEKVGYIARIGGTIAVDEHVKSFEAPQPAET